MPRKAGYPGCAWASLLRGLGPSGTHTVLWTHQTQEIWDYYFKNNFQLGEKGRKSKNCFSSNDLICRWPLGTLGLPVLFLKKVSFYSPLSPLDGRAAAVALSEPHPLAAADLSLR